MQHEPGRCAICACTDERPCLGGAVFASRFEADHAHRLVPDEDLLQRGATCTWVEGLPLDVCSAHSEEEVATALAYAGEELPRMVSL